MNLHWSTAPELLLLPRIKQSVYRAELLAVARALEECQPHEIVSDCKGGFKAVQALQTGRRHPKGRNRASKRGPNLPCSLVRGSDGWKPIECRMLWAAARLPPPTTMAVVKLMS
eukprot:5306076-Amphidinium_carterae.2